jgi:methionyl aminopeptidase
MKSPTINRVVSKNRSMLMVYAGRRGLSELLSIGKGGDDQSKESKSKRAPLEPGTVSPPRPVPASILRPPYADSGRMPDWDARPQRHDAAGLEKMRAACRLAAQVLDHAGTLVRPGVTTDEIDKAVHDMIIAAGAYPSPLNYGGFPKSVCTSVNEVICHGIPDSRPLKEGDIVNIDVTVYLNGYHGDTSRMFAVGQISDSATRLCTATTEALMAGIQACGPGVRFASIGNAIQKVADSYKFSLSRTFVGHGVGTVFHAYPHILHHRNNEPGRMEPGMTFTIEPMLCEGSAKEKFWSDQWTAVTIDGGLSAQQEHTLLITDSGVEILTVSQ